MTPDVSARQGSPDRESRLGRLLPPGLRQALSLRSAGVVYALVLLLAVLTISSSQKGGQFYLSSINVSNILDQSTFVGILAIFMTVVLITGNFDLSIASTAALAGTVALELIDGHGVLVAVAAALLLAALVGAVNAVLVQKVGVNAFIVTLGTLTAVRGVVQVILDGQSITATDQALMSFSTKYWAMPQGVAIGLGLAALLAVAALCARARGLAPLGKTQLVWVPALALLGAGAFRPLLLNERLSVWIMLFLTLAVSAVMRFTVLGRNLYAVGGNTEAARLAGINVDRYKMGAFVLNALMAGAVGILYAGKFNSVDPTVLTGTELTVIAAAVLGGTSLFGGSGFVVKSVIGALILFTLSNGFNVLNIGANYQNVVQGGVLIAAASLYTATSTRGRGFLRSRWHRIRNRPADPGAASVGTGPDGGAADGWAAAGRPGAVEVSAPAPSTHGR